MKKMFIMLISIAAFSAQAASVEWSSGSLKKPTDATGTIGDKGNIGANDGYMTIWFFTTFIDAQAFVNGGYTGSAYASTETDTSASGGGYSGSVAGFELSTTYYTVAYVETTITGDTENPVLNNTWYMYSSIAEFTTQGTGDSSVNFLNGNGTTGATRLWDTKWTAVPEPATAMLALAGVALLIRRRK